MNTDKLTRLAFIYAEQDRRSYLDAIRHTDMKQEIKETKALIKYLYAYRMKKWGETQGESDMKNCIMVDIEELKGLSATPSARGEG